jgi:hypothetical protein
MKKTQSLPATIKVPAVTQSAPDDLVPMTPAPVEVPTKSAAELHNEAMLAIRTAQKQKQDEVRLRRMVQSRKPFHMVVSTEDAVKFAESLVKAGSHANITIKQA